MSRGRSDSLFQLIKSLSKNEKRYFKLFAGRVNGGGDKKIIHLFDLVNEQEVFDEERILKKGRGIKASQLSNMKADLYKQLLQSIRLFHTHHIADLEIRQLIDYAQILFDRRMYQDGLKQLQKAKKMAHKHNNLELMLETIKLEKSVLSQTIDQHNQRRVGKIIREARQINEQISMISQLSNLADRLNALYKKVGFIRDQRDFKTFERYFYRGLPAYSEGDLSVLEKIYLYNLYIGYYFFIQDFERGCAEGRKMVTLFDKNPSFIHSKTDLYVQGINKMLIAQFKLSRYKEFVETSEKLKAVADIPGLRLNEDIRAKLLKYIYLHKINAYFIVGDFDGGIQMISRLEEGIQTFIDRLDKHASIIFYYKIACLYFGAEDYSRTALWTQKIIGMPAVDLRQDIHCFARILNLIAHFELGNTDSIEYYLRSTYRFLAKKHDLRLYQTYILRFIKELELSITEEELVNKFKKLRSQLLPLTTRAYEKRAFIYFDIISWLESKIQKRSVQEVIREKAQKKIQLNSVLSSGIG